MTPRLEAWLEGRHAGQFIFDADGVVTFAYDPDAPATPVSLSLPRDRPARRKAAANFLDNLLPDHEVARIRMASAYGAASTSIPDLLAQAGGDIAGGLVLTPEGVDAPFRGPAQLNPALSFDVADRISSIKRDPDAWASHATPARFSLAGTQGKFALARVDDDWYWSNASVPSTHIVKPGRPELRGLEVAEASALMLAAAVGVPAASGELLHVEDQAAFITARFDRAPGQPLAARLHTEDLAQAMGIGPELKYRVSAQQVIELIADVDADGSIRRAFIAQLAFNTIIGNADAHAKNYSILLRPDGAFLSPLYDSVPVGLYPGYEQDLAMRIAGARRPRAVTPDHWRKLARSSGLDQDEIVDIVAKVATGVLERNHDAWDGLDVDQRDRLREMVRHHAEVAIGAERAHR